MRAVQLAAQLGFNQMDIARIVEVSPGTVNTWFNGNLSARGDNLSKLAKALGTTTEFLLYGDTTKRKFGKPANPDSHLLIEYMDWETYETTLIPVSNDLIKKWPNIVPDQLLVCQMPDSTLAPAIPLGATLFFNQDVDEIENDSYYMLCDSKDVLRVRRCSLSGGSLIAPVSINGEYLVERYDPDQSYLMGKLIEYHVTLS